MIEGRINRRNEAVIALEIRGRVTSLPVEATIDTEFNGCLSLTSKVIGELGLKSAGVREGTLADGSVTVFNAYVATTTAFGPLRAVTVIESAGGNLLGMELLAGSRLTLDVVEGGLVVIEPLPPRKQSGKGRDNE